MIGNESRSDKFGTNGTMPHKDTPQSNGMPHPFGNPEGVYGATPQSNTDWREEFDRLKITGIGAWKTSADRNTIKSFISQLLEAEKKRWREEVEKLYVEPTESDDGYMTGLTEANERLSHNKRIAYNQALDAVLQKLS